MAPSYNIDLPLNGEGAEPAPNKERGLCDTMSIASSRSPNDSSTMFRGTGILRLGLGICFLVFFLLASLFIQIFVANEYIRQGREIITTAPIGPTLAIIWVLAVLLLRSIPLVAELDSYGLAWAWLEASVDNGHNRPTPFQLGVIMSILHGANFSALCEGLKYMYGPTTRASPKPPILRRAMFTLTLGLGLVFSFTILAISLSFLSKTISFSQFAEYRGTWPQLSRQLNSSMCATTSGALAQGINVCGLESPGDNPFSVSLPEALRTLTNNSVTNAVAFGDDGTAIIVAASIPEDFVYSGTTFGVLSACQSITDQCVGSGPSSGSEYGMPYQVDSNPFRFGAVAVSEAHSSPADTFAGNTGFFAHGAARAFNVLTCSVMVRSVNYTYFNGTFIVDPSSTVPAYNLDITRAVAAMTSAADLSIRVPLAIDGAGLAGGNYASAFGRELSRELIAFSAALYAPAAPQELQTVVPTLGSRLSLVLLALIFIWIVVYCGFVLFLTISAVMASTASPYTLLARHRLADPLTAVHAAYGRAEPHRTFEQSNERLFSAETDQDRLTRRGLAFGVSTAATASSV
ncbi:hypothetical protein B0H12DRAFT_1138372 [Mycena haematopus]|nr:hypothetical protein B0H12DRAFT_1138372 [Mycena haematopus]